MLANIVFRSKTPNLLRNPPEIPKNPLSEISRNKPSVTSQPTPATVGVDVKQGAVPPLAGVGQEMTGRETGLFGSTKRTQGFSSYLTLACVQTRGSLRPSHTAAASPPRR